MNNIKIWKDAAEKEIENILLMEPSVIEAVNLSSLFNIQDKLSCLLDLAEKNEIVPENIVDTLLCDLNRAFRKYSISKGELIINPSERNNKTVINNLNSILKLLNQIILLLLQSSCEKEEIELIEIFFKRYSENYISQNVNKCK